MNGFALHGIEHLSPSSINAYAAAPALWAVERLLGYRSPPSAAMARGTASEAGISAGLFDPHEPVEQCVTLALKEFDRLTAFNTDSRRQDERDAIPGIVQQGLEELRQYGIPTRPDGRQHFVSIMLEGVPVPVIGYKDWQWDQHGIVVDLKSQLRLASEISTGHARQGAVYVHGTNNEMRFLYATPKKRACYRLENIAEHINALRQIALRMNKFLSLSTDKAELVGLLVPDFDSFYWNNPIMRARGHEVFGF